MSEKKIIINSAIVSKDYEIEVSRDFFSKLITIDEDLILEEKMKMRGASNITWSGHFGAHIYFSLSEKDSANLPRILEGIEDFAEEICKQ